MAIVNLIFACELRYRSDFFKVKIVKKKLHTRKMRYCSARCSILCRTILFRPTCRRFVLFCRIFFCISYIVYCIFLRWRPRPPRADLCPVDWRESVEVYNGESNMVVTAGGQSELSAYRTLCIVPMTACSLFIHTTAALHDGGRWKQVYACWVGDSLGDC